MWRLNKVFETTRQKRKSEVFRPDVEGFQKMLLEHEDERVTRTRCHRALVFLTESLLNAVWVAYCLYSLMSPWRLRPRHFVHCYNPRDVRTVPRDMHSLCWRCHSIPILINACFTRERRLLLFKLLFKLFKLLLKLAALHFDGHWYS